MKVVFRGKLELRISEFQGSRFNHSATVPRLPRLPLLLENRTKLSTVEVYRLLTSSVD